LAENLSEDFIHLLPPKECLHQCVEAHLYVLELQLRGIRDFESLNLYIIRYI
jgi:hypothetical protein